MIGKVLFENENIIIVQKNFKKVLGINKLIEIITNETYREGVLKGDDEKCNNKAERV